MGKPTVLKEKSFRLLGCVFYGDPFHSAEEWTYENEIGKLWERYGKLYYKYLKLLSKINITPNLGFELHLEPREFKKNKKYYVMVGMEVDKVEEIPLEMFFKILPTTSYVTFTTTNENRYSHGAQVFKEWIPKQGYEQGYPFILQAYDEKRYRGLEDQTSEIDWYIPVKKVL